MHATDSLMCGQMFGGGQGDMGGGEGGERVMH